MIENKYFKSLAGNIPLPLFFPDATRAVVKTLDSTDIEATKTPGILVNTFHLYDGLGKKVMQAHKGIRNFMGWKGAVISDSGGFQVMSLIKANPKIGRVEDKGVVFRLSKKKTEIFSPEKSIDFQMALGTDLLVVLDDFTGPNDKREQARETVERTVLWAKRCKKEFEKICERKKITRENQPYLIAVVQGGEYMDLRKECTQRLCEIGFDGYGYGGWPIDREGNFDYQSAQIIADNTPKDSLLYGLGIGKPNEIAGCVKLGFDIFDCVLPTRDARHKRLYVYEADSINKIDVSRDKFYKYYTPDKEKYYHDTRPISTACDCALCQNYSRSYLSHLFRIKELSSLRLASIHNLRFYSILMEKLRKLR